MTKRIIIIGGGPSLIGKDITDLRSRGIVVGVNDAALLCRCDYGLSMDRLWTENRWEAALKANPKMGLWIRDAAMRNIANVPRNMFKFHCDNNSCEFTPDISQVNGSNSGTVALNFALQMDPSEIYLLGFDMQKGPNNEPYWYPPYPWAVPQGGTTSGKYKVWAQEFETVQRTAKERATKIFNVNHRSAIKTFPVLTWEQFLAAF